MSDRTYGVVEIDGKTDKKREVVIKCWSQIGFLGKLACAYKEIICHRFLWKKPKNKDRVQGIVNGGGCCVSIRLG